MTVSTIKFLTKIALTLVCFAASVSSAQIFNPESGKTHLRWNLFAGKEQVVVAKRGDKLTIKTLNPSLFEDIKNEIMQAAVDQRYVKETRYLSPKENNNVSTVEVTLTSPEVEVFSFYKDRDKKYVIDFWMDVDKLSSLTPVKSGTNESTSTSKEVSNGPKILAREEAPKAAVKAIVEKEVKKESKWRDFRYGASFVWDYPALSPQINLGIDLARKTPEFFYPIKDRDFNKGDKEAHLQLCINLYKKKEWGLMAKSIELFQRKYGSENEIDLLEYLKANAMIRENMNGGNTEPVKSAVAMFSNISARTSDYDLKRATTKYLMAFDANNEDYVSVLKRAKEFYVVSKENHDYEESAEAAKIILHALAKLKQVEKIDELLKEKTIAKILPAQVMLGYKMYAQLSLGNEKDVIKSYLAAAPGLVKPVHEAILFNAAEAMFREAQFSQAVKLFDSFISQHSYHSNAALARTRLALAYEMQGREVPLVAKLYKEAIDRSGNSSEEARIRYVAVTNLRNKSPSKKDKEYRVLLDSRTGDNDLDKYVHKILWQTRLRIFIADGEYEKALSYLSAIPLTGMPPSERRAFEGDGSEIVYGMMLKSFEKGNYAQVVKTWETFKQKYVEKVANDPHLNHLVGKSLIKLGLYRGYEEVSAGFRSLDTTPTRTFPLWVKRTEAVSAEVALAELDVIKALRSEDSNVEAKIVAFEKLDPKNPKNAFYRGLVARSSGDAKATVKWMEDFLVSSGNKRDLDAEEVAEMVMAYTDSLYQTNQIKKFEKVSQALLEDTEKLSNSNEYMTQVRERIAYLNLEVMAGKSTDLARAQLEKGILKFKKNYPNSQFRDRLGFLLGTAMIDNSNIDQGVKIFNEMLSDGKVSDTIKEMIKSELSLLKIKERTLL